MIETIINFINTKINTLNLFHRRFGICELVDKGEGSEPCEYCNFEYKPVLDSDPINGISYHRLRGEATVREAEEEMSVSCTPFLVKTLPLKTVAIFRKDILGTGNNNGYIESKIAENIINTVFTRNNKALRTELQVDSVSVEIDSIITNREEILNQEFDRTEGEVKIDSDYALIAINYNIIVTGNSNCFEVYEC